MNIEANRQIGRKLKELRKAQGLTQARVAKALSKPQSYVSKVESGEKSLHLYEVFDYAAALGIRSEALLSEARAALGENGE